MFAATCTAWLHSLEEMRVCCMSLGKIRVCVHVSTRLKPAGYSNTIPSGLQYPDSQFPLVLIMRCLYVFLLALAPLTLHAQISLDFSNNLATDLGPLLALFGENVTKQYLSESTFYLDYVIFSIAPIGILTILSSVIRVCGSPSLRAFIGRAQEGFGSVEAELCTSTSRTVCELFNNGGIARVMGRPKILEMIFLPNETFKPDGMGKIEVVGKIMRFQNHLTDVDKTESPTETEWRKRKRLQKSEKKVITEFPPNPNLTLNVGIRRPRTAYFWAITLFGFLLQAAVLVVAGVGAFQARWMLGLDSATEGEEVSVNLLKVKDSALAFITGTICMNFGVFLCALLIGISTHEDTYKRKADQSGSQNSQLFWIQPGNQVIGDQTFDAFAYIEKEKPIREYISSRRADTANTESSQYETLAIIAVIITLGGYVTQFVGLRGLGPWIAIGQLAITVIMSILRGFLRRRNLNKDSNRVAHFLDLVVGHELDWLAFKINSEPAVRAKTINSASTPYQWFVTGDRSAMRAEADSMIIRILAHRCQLALVTGVNEPPSSPSAIQHRKNPQDYWATELVKVRLKARQVADALCQTASILRSGEKNPYEITIRLPISMRHKGSSTGFITLTIEPPPKNRIDGRWKISQALVESILGLWVWSFHAPYAAKAERDKSKQDDIIPSAEAIPKYRIVEVDDVADGQERGTSLRAELELWGEDIGNSFSQGFISSKHESFFSGVALWSDGTKFEPSELVLDDEAKVGHTKPGSQRRFLGWASVLNREDPQQQGEGKGSSAGRRPADSNTDTSGATTSKDVTEHRNLRIGYVSSGGDLLSECALELYSLVIMQIVEPRHDIGSITSTTDGQDRLRLNNQTISALQKVFTHPNISLGSNTDALLCLLPAFRGSITQKLTGSDLAWKLLYKDDLVDRLPWHVKQLEESYLLYARDLSEQYWLQSQSPQAKALVQSSLVYIGELYRVCFYGQYDEIYHSRFYPEGIMLKPHLTEREFAYRGVHFLLDSFARLSNPREAQDDGCCDVLLTYIALIIHFAYEHGEERYLPPVITDGTIAHDSQPWASRLDEIEINMPLNRPDFDDFYQNWRRTICDDSTEFWNAVKSKQRARSLYYMSRLDCRRSWREQDTADDAYGLDELNAPRWGLSTPLHLAASYGWEEVVRYILSRDDGRYRNHRDSLGMTALMHSAAIGHLGHVHLLMYGDKKLREEFGAGIRSEEEDKASSPYFSFGHGMKVLDKDGYGALFHAAQNGHAHVVRYMLGGFNNGWRKAKCSPLSAAACKGHSEVVEVLLKHSETDVSFSGASPDGKPRNITPFQEAVDARHEKVAGKFIRSGRLRKSTVEDTVKTLRTQGDNDHLAESLEYLMHRQTKWAPEE